MHHALAIVRVVAVVDLDGGVVCQHKVRVPKVGGSRLGARLALDAQRHVVQTDAEAQDAARGRNAALLKADQRLQQPRRSIVERGDQLGQRVQGAARQQIQILAQRAKAQIDGLRAQLHARRGHL